LTRATLLDHPIFDLALRLLDAVGIGGEAGFSQVPLDGCEFPCAPAHLTGEFPGAPADLRYRFRLTGDKVADLEITVRDPRAEFTGAASW
jgi:hypothetical protein